MRGIDVAKKQEARRGGRDLWRGHGFYWREQASNSLPLSKPHGHPLCREKKLSRRETGRQTIIRKEPRAELQKARKLCNRKDQIRVRGNYFFWLDAIFF